MNKQIIKIIASCMILTFIVFLVACSRTTDIPTAVSVPPSPTVAPTANIAPSLEPTPTDTPTPTPTPDLRIAVDRKNFPDSTFRNYILDHFDSDYDNMVSSDDLGVMFLDVSDRGIEDLTGIEYFPYLHNLNCSKNHLKQLDVSGIARLDVLDCSDNPDLTSVTLGDNVESIERLNCNNTNFSLDTFQCKHLIELHSRQSGLKRLEFRASSPLEILDCNNASLSISGCKQLRTIDCTNCNLLNSSSFDFSFPELTKLNIFETNIIDFDLSECPKLNTLDVTSNQLGTFRAKGLDFLRQATVTANALYGEPLKATADFANCKNLKSLSVYGFKSVNVSGCTNLTEGFFSYDWEYTKVTGFKGR